MPETTLPTAPKDFKPFEGDEMPEKQQKRTPDEYRASAQKGRDTRLMSQFESVNTFPRTTEDLKGWADSLSDTNRRRAMELDIQLQKRGKTGLLDPKLSPYEKSVVEQLFHETSPHWFNQRQQKMERKKKSPVDSDERFKLDPKRSELPQVPNAVAALGGQMMEGEDAA
ncbi:MAG: hypothetical protein KGL39_12375 [Patescibacteria group bacterium]|nr:hypothetical protein [Patescibacteria group bacterium]